MGGVELQMEMVLWCTVHNFITVFGVQGLGDSCWKHKTSVYSFTQFNSELSPTCCWVDNFLPPTLATVTSKIDRKLSMSMQGLVHDCARPCQMTVPDLVRWLCQTLSDDCARPCIWQGFYKQMCIVRGLYQYNLTVQDLVSDKASISRYRPCIWQGLLSRYMVLQGQESNTPFL